MGVELLFTHPNGNATIDIYGQYRTTWRIAEGATSTPSAGSQYSTAQSSQPKSLSKLLELCVAVSSGMMRAAMFLAMPSAVEMSG